MNSVDLSIIIVNWNSKDYLQKCVASILAKTSGLEYEIIVVDSASFDGCGDMLQRLYPQVRFIQSERNVGFARANNLGAKHARGNVLLCLNPDTLIRGNAIQCLYGRLHDLPNSGIVGCRLLNRDGSLQITSVQPLPTILNQVLNARIFERWFPNSGIWTSAATFEGVTTPVPVEVVTGACMMIGRDVFDHVGGFSTDYFMYAEDLDLCYKTRAEGFINYYVPEVEIVHYGGGSTKHAYSRFSSIMKCESVSRFLRKTRGELYRLGYRLALIGAAVIRLMLLALYFPIAFLKRKTSTLRAAVDKWVGISCWGIGGERWVHKYAQVGEVDAGLNGANKVRCSEPSEN